MLRCVWGLWERCFKPNTAQTRYFEPELFCTNTAHEATALEISSTLSSGCTFPEVSRARKKMKQDLVRTLRSPTALRSPYVSRRAASTLHENAEFWGRPHAETGMNPGPSPPCYVGAVPRHKHLCVTTAWRHSDWCAQGWWHHGFS